MSGKSLHSWYGFSVGQNFANVIDQQGNVSANFANFLNVTASTAHFSTASANSFSVSGNLVVTGNIVGNIVGNLRAPGADDSVLYTISGNTSASSNFTFNPTINFLHVSNGNFCVDGSNGGGKVIANYFWGDGSNVTNVRASSAVTVTGSSQPNITTLDNITRLVISNTGGMTIGNVANVSIPGSTPGQALVANTDGNLSWGYTSRIANGNSSVSIPTVNGPVIFSVGGSANTLVVNGPSTGNPTPNVTIAGDLLTSGNISATHFTGDGSRLSNINSANIVGNIAMSGSFLVIGRQVNKTIVVSGGAFGVATRSGTMVING